MTAICPNGIRYFEIRDGAFNSKAFLSSMRALVRRFLVLRIGEVTLVMDNALIHKARLVMDFFNEKGVEFQYLPLYTNDSNPIEKVFGPVKEKYLSVVIPKTREAMKAQLGNVLENFNVDLRPDYSQMRTFVQRTLNRESIN